MLASIVTGKGQEKWQGTMSTPDFPLTNKQIWDPLPWYSRTWWALAGGQDVAPGPVVEAGQLRRPVHVQVRPVAPELDLLTDPEFRLGVDHVAVRERLLHAAGDLLKMNQSICGTH